MPYDWTTKGKPLTRATAKGRLQNRSIAREFRMAHHTVQQEARLVSSLSSLRPSVTSELPLVIASNVAKPHQRLLTLFIRAVGRLAVSPGKFHRDVTELATRPDI